MNGGALGVTQSGQSDHTLNLTTLSLDANNDLILGSDGGLYYNAPPVAVRINDGAYGNARVADLATAIFITEENVADGTTTAAADALEVIKLATGALAVSMPLMNLLVNDGGYGSSRDIDPDVDVLQTEEQPHDPTGWPVEAGDLCPLEDQEPVFKSAVDGKYYTRKVFDPFCESEVTTINTNSIEDYITNLGDIRGQGFQQWIDFTAETGLTGFTIPADACTPYLVEAFIQVVGFNIDAYLDPGDSNPSLTATLDLGCDGDRVWVAQTTDQPSTPGYTGDGDRFANMYSATFKKCLKMQPGDTYVPDLVGNVNVGNSTEDNYFLEPVSTNGRINITYTATPCRNP